MWLSLENALRRTVVVFLLVLFLLLIELFGGQEQVSVVGAGGGDLARPLKAGAQLQSPHVSDHCCRIECLLQGQEQEITCLWNMFTSIFENISVRLMRKSVTSYCTSAFYTHINIYRTLWKPFHFYPNPVYSKFHFYSIAFSGSNFLSSLTFSGLLFNG